MAVDMLGLFPLIIQLDKAPCIIYHMEYLFALQTFNLPIGRHIQVGRDKKEWTFNSTN